MEKQAFERLLTQCFAAATTWEARSTKACSGVVRLEPESPILEAGDKALVAMWEAATLAIGWAGATEVDSLHSWAEWWIYDNECGGKGLEVAIGGELRLAPRVEDFIALLWEIRPNGSAAT